MSEDLVSGSVEQLASALKIYASTWADADLVDRPGIKVSWPDSPFSLWNGLLLNEKTPAQTRLRSDIVDAAGYMRHKKQMGLLYACEDYVSIRELEALMADLGMAPRVRLTGMVADLRLPPRPPITDLQIVKVDDQKTAADFATIISETYNISQDDCVAEFVDKAFWREDAYAYISYFQDKPASVSSIVVDKDTLYVGLVATRPSLQNRGLSYETNFHMLKAVQDSTGIRHVALHATSQGLPVYTKLGFRPVTMIIGFGFERQYSH